MSCVTLRPFTREEYHDFFRRYEPDPLMDPNPYRYQFTNVDKSFDFNESRKEWYPTFGIFANGEAVGTLSLKRIDREKKKCEIGLMMVNDDCKNKGYGTAAMRKGISMATQQYGVMHIWADTMGRNLRMQHVLEKLGFRLVERIRQVYDMPAGKDDRLVYVLEAEK